MRCNFLRNLVVCLSSATGLLAISGCYSMNGYVMNASGQSYYDKGNYAAAAAEFQNAAASDPANPDYIANLARTQYKMGNAAGAEQLYRQALTMAPSHQPSYHGMSEVMMASGRGDQAAQLLNTWAATQPYVAESHVELAWLQHEMGDKHAAAQSLQNALQANPNHATALAHLGQYYHEEGQPAQAVAMYQQALQANWNQPEVHSRLASAAQAAGPSSPMAATAMARGVHPHSVPRQQMAFGPPNSGMQFAQAPMPPGMMPPMMAGQMQPRFAQQQFAQAPMSPGMMPQNVQMAGFHPPMAGPGQLQSPNPLAGAQSGMHPMPAMSFGPGSAPSGSPEVVNFTPAPQSNREAVAAPVADPAFAQPVQSQVPAMTISDSSTVSEAVTASNSGAPEVEAF